jgi:aminoglycoside phosphotransferase (APT) family kinase protein
VAQYRRRVVLHDDELNIDEGDVRRLITEQFPEWRHERIRRIATDGTVNAIHRVGNGHTARFPLRSSDPIEAAAELRREAIAMDEFADVCPFPSPKHVAMGAPETDIAAATAAALGAVLLVGPPAVALDGALAAPLPTLNRYSRVAPARV